MKVQRERANTFLIDDVVYLDAVVRMTVSKLMQNTACVV